MIRPANPDCPRCGCDDVTILREPDPGTNWFAYTRLRCNHCGRVWNARPAAAAESDEPSEENETPAPPVDTTPVYRPAVRPKCPECGSRENRVTSTELPIRHHKCQCGAAFKSVEAAIDEL